MAGGANCTESSDTGLWIEDEAPVILQVAALVLLLGCVFLGGALADRVGCPALIAEIVVGMVLSSLRLVPYVDALTAIGQLGLLLLVLEGG